MSCIYFICTYSTECMLCVCRASLRCSLLFLVYNKCTILSHLIFNSLTSFSSSSLPLSFCIKMSVSCAISFAHADTHLHLQQKNCCVRFFAATFCFDNCSHRKHGWICVQFSVYVHGTLNRRQMNAVIIAIDICTVQPTGK